MTEANLPMAYLSVSQRADIEQFQILAEDGQQI